VQILEGELSLLLGKRQGSGKNGWNGSEGGKATRQGLIFPGAGKKAGNNEQMVRLGKRHEIAGGVLRSAFAKASADSADRAGVLA
jgi:hypothetical protein